MECSKNNWGGDSKGNFWYVSTFVSKIVKIDETVVFLCDEKGNVFDYSCSEELFKPSNHSKACSKYLKYPR